MTSDPVIWLVEQCQHCHPSDHQFGCDPVLAFRTRDEAEAWVAEQTAACRTILPPEGCLRVVDAQLWQEVER